jgi:hypothetical protein
MISCEHTQNLFEAYLNDEVPASLVAELDAHCLSCGDCRQQLSLLEACGNVVRLDTSEPAVSEDFTQRLVRILETNDPSRTPRRLARPLKVAGGLVGLAAVLAMAVMLVQRPAGQAPMIMGVHAGPGGSSQAAPSVSGALLREFLGAPLPLLQLPEGLSAFLELSDLTLEKLGDAAAAEKPALDSLPLAPGPAEKPDVLETLPPFEDDDGELM